MPIHEAIKADWKTPEILIEGSLNCAKTTVFLDKEIDALFKWPGIKTLLFRWSEDAVETKLKPAFEELLYIRGLTADWEAKPKRFVFPNESIVYMFGLKAVSLIEQYNKIRGLGLSRIGGDQVEEVAQQVAGELRGRLRPDLTATTIRQMRYPFQITFVSNSEDDDFWLSKEFPVDNRIKGRKVYQLSVFDNKHLPQESIESLLRQWPPEHPKHRTMVLGRRGPNITGVPVYEGLYKKEIHHRAVAIRPDAPFFEAIEFGKHNPAYVFGQPTYAGGLTLLGGIRAQEMVLEDFLPIVKQYRQAWLPKDAAIRTATGPTGSFSAMVGSGFSALDILKEAGMEAVYNIHGNAPDVRLSVIENISGLLRRRTPSGDESIAINNDPAMWLIASREEVKQSALLHIAFEAGYTWAKNFVSVANKEVRQPHEDDKFANVMHCVEHIVLNFCAGQMSEADRDTRDERRARADADSRQRMPTSQHSWMGV